MRGGGVVLHLSSVVGREVSIKKPANTQKTGKRGGKTKTSWRPGQSGNPRGAPKRGQSWKEIVKTIGDLTPKEASDYCHKVAGKIAVIGDSVTLKEAVILRVYTALLFEPDARLLNVIIDRDEGKVVQPVAVTWREELRRIGFDDVSASELFEQLVQSAAARVGADDGGGDS